MQPLVSFNREILPASAAILPIVSPAAFYGRGVFTTLAVYHGKPFLWDFHEKRLRENALKIGIDISNLNVENLQHDLLDLIRVNKLNDGRARITLFDASSNPIWQAASESKTDVLINTAERRRPLPDNFRLTVSPFRVNSTSPLAGVKSCNYLENILALDAAKQQNFDEAVRLNERGEIVSATMANLFWIKDEIIFTPDLHTGALGGTTRQFVIGLSKQMGFVVNETMTLFKDLQAADEIFLSSAGLGIYMVESLNSQILSDTIASKIRTAFAEIVNV